MEPAASTKNSPAPPVHVAIIMDGNGRWAHRRGLPRAIGHRRGAQVARATIKDAIDLGISYLTLYSFSSENWNRPTFEIEALMGLLRHYLRSEVAELHKTGVRIGFIGDRSRLPADIIALAENAERLTRDNTRIRLTMALSYGSRAEIVMAARRVARRVLDREIAVDDIDENLMSASMQTAGTPDPDLVIRTSGEQRLSNFLMWQAAYAELVFVDTLWPDFSREDFEAAISEFHRRERRYGASGT